MNSRNVNNMAGGPSAGPTPIEAAAEAIAPWLTFQGEPTWPEKVAVHVIETWVRAAVGCPTCKGTRVWKNDADMVHEKCPKEHVKLTVLGGTIGSDSSAATKLSGLVAWETIYADPDKCEWRCVYTNHLSKCTASGVKPFGHGERTCGWQPRWSAIMGGERWTKH